MRFPKKPFTPEELEQLLETELRKFRLETVLARKIPKWSKGRLFCLHNQNTFTFSMNHPSVRHLNLKEIAFSGDSFEVPEMFVLQEKIRCDPFVLDISVSGDRCSKLEPPSEEMLAWHRDKAKKIIDCDREIIGLISLMDMWDEEKFLRLLDYRIHQELPYDTSAFRIVDINWYLDILIAFCKNSLFIVEALKKICTHFQKHDYCFLNLLPYFYIKFFNWHLKRTYTEYFDSAVRVDWLHKEDLLRSALSFCDVEDLKVFLELEWPSVLLPFTIPLDGTATAGSWPKKKAGIAARSFNSLEYFKILTNELISMIVELTFYSIYDHQCWPKEKFRNCLRVIWRAIPTPYLPIEDVRKCVDFNRVISETYDDVSIAKQEEAAAELKSMLEEGYEENFSGMLQPRSLQQLSRFAVRRRCRSPEQIAHLPLPKLLKKYISLEI